MNDNLLANKEKFLDETCSYCHNKLTLFGSKKIKDGILCRNCVNVCSKWLNDIDYENMNLEDIKRHIKYRGDNYYQLDNLNINRKVEGKYTLYIDDTNNKFYFSKRKDLKKDNADIFDFKEILEICIIEDIYEDENIRDILLEIKLNNPEIKNIIFRINEFPGLDKNSQEYLEASKLADEYLEALILNLNVEVVEEEEI